MHWNFLNILIKIYIVFFALEAIGVSTLSSSFGSSTASDLLFGLSISKPASSYSSPTGDLLFVRISHYFSTKFASSLQTRSFLLWTSAIAHCSHLSAASSTRSPPGAYEAVLHGLSRAAASNLWSGSPEGYQCTSSTGWKSATYA